jgi:hypothetical protein
MFWKTSIKEHSDQSERLKPKGYSMFCLSDISETAKIISFETKEDMKLKTY